MSKFAWGEEELVPVKIVSSGVPRSIDWRQPQPTKPASEAKPPPLDAAIGARRNS